jgi:hypothetical protein
MLFDDGSLCFATSTAPRQTPCSDHMDSSDCWRSPLTMRWLDKHARTCLESPVAALGRLMHSWMATFLDQTNKGIRPTENGLRKRFNTRHEIEHFIGVVVPVTNNETAMLACCQWATSVMLEVDQCSIPIWKAAQLRRIQPRLVSCLRMTDLTSLWGDRRGMLFWVVAVCHCATTGHCFPLLTTALQARFAHVMALSEEFHAEGMISLRRLHLFERLCLTPRD